jgi:hypothetical protein
VDGFGKLSSGGRLVDRTARWSASDVQSAGDEGMVSGRIGNPPDGPVPIGKLPIDVPGPRITLVKMGRWHGLNGVGGAKVPQNRELQRFSLFAARRYGQSQACALQTAAADCWQRTVSTNRQEGLES